MAPSVELRGITKAFPGVVANDHIDFSAEESEIHGLLGENGAGKTVLMSILYGLYRPDEGKILVKGEEVAIPSQNSKCRPVGESPTRPKLKPGRSEVRPCAMAGDCHGDA